MRKLFLATLLLSVLSSCDPVSTMDANILNSTSESISLVLVSSVEPNETFQIAPNETILFREGFSTTGNFLKPELIEYDSIYIQNESNEVLKVFKENTAGKNIYKIDDYWSFDEPAKRYYQYDYEITNEDIQ
ncbi:MAG: hypothetical protein JXR05_15675 [Flavobacteriaceae bacterium]